MKIKLKWQQRAFELVEKYLSQRKGFAMDDFRTWARGSLSKPRHPNCWGNLVKHLRDCKIIAPSHMRRSRHKTAHHRKLMVWRKTAWGVTYAQ